MAPPPRKLPGCDRKLIPCVEGREKQRGGPVQMAGGGFDNQGSLFRRLVLGSHKTASLPLSAKS